MTSPNKNPEFTVRITTVDQLPEAMNARRDRRDRVACRIESNNTVVFGDGRTLGHTGQAPDERTVGEARA